MKSLLQFLHLFENSKLLTFQQFIKDAQVRSTNRLVPLKQYMEQRNISQKDIRLLYEHIVNRNEYLERFYRTSLEVGSLKITENPMPRSHLDNNTLVKYKNVIRHLHMRNILQRTKSGLDNVPSFLDVLFDLYKKNIIDYKILTPSAIHYIREGRIGSVFSSFYFRASIMNPYLVYSLNQSVLKGTRIFTPTLGWSSYAYGFAECPSVTEYVGVDVIDDVCNKTVDFMKNYPHINTRIYCTPSESLLANRHFMQTYREHFDTVFFSPPYYELELYPGKQQSTTVYKSYEDWLNGYWLGTLKVCHHVLKKGGSMCYILSEGGGKDQTHILKDMNGITKTLFKLKHTLPMYNKNVFVTAGSHRDTSEKIMVFVKS
jgi:hypothetical protein